MGLRVAHVRRAGSPRGRQRLTAGRRNPARGDPAGRVKAYSGAGSTRDAGMNADMEPSLLARQRMAFEMIDRGDALQDILALLCHIVEAEARSMVRAAILLVDDSGTRLRTGAAPGLPDHYNRAVNGIGIAADVGTCAAAAALGRPVITPDIATDAGWLGLSHLPLGLGLQAAWSMPIVARNGRMLGTFGTYFSERREPTPYERDLVAILARTAAEAIERSEPAARPEPA